MKTYIFLLLLLTGALQCHADLPFAGLFTSALKGAASTFLGGISSGAKFVENQLGLNDAKPQKPDTVVVIVEENDDPVPTHRPHEGSNTYPLPHSHGPAHPTHPQHGHPTQNEGRPLNYNKGCNDDNRPNQEMSFNQNNGYNQFPNENSYDNNGGPNQNGYHHRPNQGQFEQNNDYNQFPNQNNYNNGRPNQNNRPNSNDNRYNNQQKNEFLNRPNEDFVPNGNKNNENFNNQGSTPDQTKFPVTNENQNGNTFTQSTQPPTVQTTAPVVKPIENTIPTSKPTENPDDDPWFVPSNPDDLLGDKNEPPKRDTQNAKSNPKEAEEEDFNLDIRIKE